MSVPSPASTRSRILDQEMRLLAQFEDLLSRESDLLREFRHGELEHTSAEKERLDAELIRLHSEMMSAPGDLDDDKKQAYRSALDSVRRQSRRNLARMRAYMDSIEGLTKRLTEGSAPAQGYGPRGGRKPTTQAQSLLTNSIG